jgi:AraC family transcriptional regulator, positive regulator of tynA and feaB
MIAGEAHAAHLTGISTVAINDARKFDFFCDAICDVYAGIRPVQPDDVVFNAEFRAISVAGGVLASIAAPGHTAHRGARELHRRPEESLFLNLSELSSYDAALTGQDWHLPAGRPFLIDNSQPFHLDFDPRRRMVLHSLRFDRMALGIDLSTLSISAINHAIATTELGRHLEIQMRLMCGAMRGGEIGLSGMMSRPVIALLSLIAESVAGDRADSESLGLSTIKAVARQHLTESGFGIEQLAGLLKCSVRTVQSRFAAEETTFGHWLLAERLELARHRLTFSDFPARSIESIAYVCGFRDPAHFHRAFKRRFGLPPGQIRH